jgi:hypothetical protein
MVGALAEKRKEFGTYRLGEVGSYRMVLGNMHCSIGPEEIKIEIEKLGHTVTNTWNIERYRAGLSLTSCFFVELKPVPNNKDIFNTKYI